MFLSIHSFHPFSWTKWLVLSLIFGSMSFSNLPRSAQASLSQVNPEAFGQTGLESQERSPSTPGFIWQIVTVDQNAGPNNFDNISLVMDSSDQPHLSYLRRPPNTNNNDLEYVHRDASGWHFFKVVSDVPGDYYSINSSMVLDSLVNAHIAYSTATEGLRYVHETYHYYWNFETLADSATHPSLKLDSNNNPYISYIGLPSGQLKYAYKDAYGWQILTADTSAFNNNSSLALVEGYYNVIVYYAEEQGDLKIVLCTSTCTTPGTVDSQGDVGSDTSLVITPPFDLHISYLDHTNYALKYAHFVYGWTIETIPSPPHVDGITSLAVDSKGSAHIAVFDLYPPGKILYFSQGPGDTWNVETVSTTYNVDSVQSIALAIDSHDVPHIAFIDDHKEGGQPKYRLSYATRISSVVFLPVVEK